MELYHGARRITCVVCGGERFTQREVLLNTRGLTFLDLDWANKGAMGAICQACGYVHLFVDGAVQMRAPQVGPQGEPAPWMDADGL